VLLALYLTNSNSLFHAQVKHIFQYFYIYEFVFFTCFWFNQFSFEAKIKFELIGIIFGLAFYNNVILDVKFPLVVYKKLLNVKSTLNDLQEIDEELYKNFMFLLNTKEKNLKDLLGTTFTATLDSFGEKQVIPLKVN